MFGVLRRHAVVSGVRTACAYVHEPAVGGNKSLYAEGVTVTTLDGMRLPMYYLNGKVVLATTFAMEGCDGGEVDVDVDVGAAAQAHVPALEEMWGTLREKGLMVLAAPVSGEWGAKRIDDAEALRAQVHAAGITIPLTEVVVPAENHPIVRFARRGLKGTGNIDLAPAGLFHKLLFSRRGKLVGSFDADASLDDVLSAVIAELNTTT